MKSLLPKHLHDLLFGSKSEKNKPRKYDADVTFTPVFQDTTHIRHLTNNDEFVEEWNLLTDREKEVVALVCMGYKNQEVAHLLGIGYGTVKSHWQSIFKKFRIRDQNLIRRSLRNWDFESWWNNRNRWELPAVRVPISRST